MLLPHAAELALQQNRLELERAEAALQALRNNDAVLKLQQSLAQFASRQASPKRHDAGEVPQAQELNSEWASRPASPQRHDVAAQMHQGLTGGPVVENAPAALAQELSRVSLRNDAAGVLRVGSHLPQEGQRGCWDGTPGHSVWHSRHPNVLRITKGQGVPFVNGYPQFKPWGLASFEFDAGVLQGTAGDARLADRLWGEHLGFTTDFARRARKQNNLVWHHVEDGRTLLLLPGQLHGNIPHAGGAVLLRRARRDTTAPCSAP